jgi:hypothetical protein
MKELSSIKVMRLAGREQSFVSAGKGRVRVG